jgi:hypothetical protein
LAARQRAGFAEGAAAGGRARNARGLAGSHAGLDIRA